jgi:WD40 repeat protein
VANLVGFTSDGKELLIDQREYGLVSGFHHLNYYAFDTKEPPAGFGGPPGFGPIARKRATVDLDSTETHGYHFAPDGKTYRTIAYERDGGAIKRLDVQEVDATTGKTLKSVFKLDYAPHVLSPDGKRLAAVDQGKVSLYDVDSGKKAYDHTLPELPRRLIGKGDFSAGRSEEPRPYMAFSPDGKRLVASRGIGQTVVLDTDTGVPLPLLEGTDLMTTAPAPGSFSGDGRLLAMAGQRYTTTTRKLGGAVQEQTVYNPAGDFLTVWDTQTGKVVKSWDRRRAATYVAFNPARPVLAILEPNGEETRLGLWDFAAEAEKK